MTELCGIKFDGFIEILPGIYYCEKDGSPWSNKKTEIVRNELGQIVKTIPINVNMLHKIKSSNGYYNLTINKKIFIWHRTVFKYFKGYLPKEIDHINNDPSDNRIENLQEITHKNNSRKANKRKDNTSGFPGVNYNKFNNKYVARIEVNDKRIFLGYFTDPLEAFKAFLQAKKQYHGPESLTPIRDSIIQHLGQNYYDNLLAPSMKAGSSIIT